MAETTSACSLQPQERSRQGQQHYWCPGKEEHEACALPGAFGGEQRAVEVWGREGVIPTGGYPCALPPENWSARGSVREASAYRAVPQPERQQTSCKSEEPTGKGKEATSMELMAGKSCAGTWAPRADEVAWMWRGD